MQINSDEGLELLIIEIIRQAVVDYKHEKRKGNNTHSIENFFNSQYFEMLTKCDGKKILELANRDVENGKVRSYCKRKPTTNTIH